MKVSTIKISNILGIDELEIAPGALTIIAGRNGAGKSSVLEAIRSVLSGGHEPDLIRQGAEAGEVSITLSDGVEIRKRITPERSALTVRHPQFGKISKSQAWLNTIVNSISLDPVAFLTARPEQRVEILLEALPMQVTAEQLGFLPVGALEGKSLDGHALEVLAVLARELYDERTGVNRAAKEKRATVAQMTETLPAQPEGGDWQEVHDDTTRAIRELQGKTRKRIEEIKGVATAAESEAKVTCERYLGEISSELERRIAELRGEADKKRAAVLQKLDSKVRAAHEDRDKYLAAEQAEYEPMNRQLQERLGQARAMLDQTNRAESTRRLIEDLDGQAAALETKSAEISGQLERLDGLKASLLEKLPVAGLEIREGEVFVDGIAFDRINESKKVRIALEVAKLKHGELGLIVLDGLERFDSDTFELFKREAIRSGLQILGARVTDSDLSVKAEALHVQ